MKEFTVSVSPHIRAPRTTQTIMRDVLIALCPALIAACITAGERALLVTAVCVAASVLFEWLYEKLMKKPVTVTDLSAAVTGMILAFNLPVTIPLWQAVFGCLVAIVAVKQLFGGLGKNFANPAVVGRIVLFLAFSVSMTNWVYPDATSSATPLAILSSGALDQLPSLSQMLLGWHGGCLGETCSVALIAGGLYLIARKVITWHIPVTFVATVFVLTALLGKARCIRCFPAGFCWAPSSWQPDYVTSPSTPWGKVVFGFGCGLITVLIRVWGSYPEGVSFAILLMNILNPYISSWTRNKPVGGAKA